MASRYVPFFQFPPELTKSIIAQFLIIRDVVQLDSAVLHKKRRRGFHKLLVGIDIQDNIFYCDRDSRKMWDWKIERGFLIRRLCGGQRGWEPGSGIENLYWMGDWLREYATATAHSLREISLYLDTFDKNTIEVIAENGAHLRKVHLQGSCGGSESIAPIARKCQKLTHLFINECTFDQNAAQSISPNLKELTIYQYKNADLHIALTRCHKLTKLHATLVEEEEEPNAPAMLAESYELIGNHLHRIHTLVVSSTCSCMAGINALCNCARLVTLECGSCNRMTAVLLEGLLRISSLRTLKLVDCEDYDCLIPGRLARGVSPITYLTIKRFRAITNKGLMTILARCSDLQYLTVTNSRALNVDLVDSIVLYGESLRLVSFESCAKLQQKMVNSWLARAGSALKITVSTNDHCWD